MGYSVISSNRRRVVNYELANMFNKQLFFLVCALLCCTGDRFEDECGYEAADSTPLVMRGENVTGNQFPWHVAIFHWEDNQFELSCSGSLVRSNLIITAAHCFSDRSHSHQVHEADYRVVAGSRLSSWDSTEIGRQESEVRKVRLGEEYGGSIRNFEDDIAIVQLTTAFTFSDTVRAVCLDLTDTVLYTKQTSPGTVGKVAGWGLTESGTPSDGLNFLRVPVVGRGECIQKLPFNFKSYLTRDKICAGLTNGSAVCPGDSGGGLVFPEQNITTNLQRWHLRGVLSNAPSQDDPVNPCLAKAFAMYTNVFKHQEWLFTNMADIIPRGAGCRVRGSVGVCRNFSDCPTAKQEVLRGIPPKYCPPVGQEVCCEEPTCPPLPAAAKTSSKAINYCLDLDEKLSPCQKNGSVWSRGNLCGPRPDDRTSTYRMSPLLKADPSEVQRYALLDITEPFHGIQVFLISERWLLVKLTELNYLLGLPGEDISSPQEVTFTVTRWVRHPQFALGNTTRGNGPINDIFLIEMDKPVTFNRRYRPVCLHTPQDSMGGVTVTTWGSWETSTPVDIMSQEDCSRMTASRYADRHLCAFSASGQWCSGNSWFYLSTGTGRNVTCTRRLVGIVLRHELHDDTCYLYLLRVAYYVPWVESVVWP